MNSMDLNFIVHFEFKTYIGGTKYLKEILKCFLNVSGGIMNQHCANIDTTQRLREIRKN